MGAASGTAPVTGRRVAMFSKSEADRILRRAAELERVDDGRPMSVDDLKSIAQEAGFGTAAIDRAIAEEQREACAGARSRCRASHAHR